MATIHIQSIAKRWNGMCWMAMAVVLAVGVQQANAGTVINACVGNLDGITRIVNSASNCGPFEHFDSWNIQGPAGPMGPQGVAGPQGAVGPAGAKGATGAQGAQGVAGPLGPQGAVGAQGPAGQTGQMGAQGPAGTAGAVGPAGQTGAQGPAGTPGAVGPAGPAGAIGQAGATGQAGPAGSPGAQGPVGEPGPAGAQGPAGTIPANLQAISNQLGISGYSNGNVFNKSECYIGDIVLSVNSYGTTGGGTDNANWTPADGSLIQISANPTLFDVIGTTFGGDGVTTFALPDMRAFAPQGLQYSICFFGIFPSKN